MLGMSSCPHRAASYPLGRMPMEESHNRLIKAETPGRGLSSESKGKGDLSHRVGQKTNKNICAKHLDQGLKQCTFLIQVNSLFLNPLWIERQTNSWAYSQFHQHLTLKHSLALLHFLASSQTWRQTERESCRQAIFSNQFLQPGMTLCSKPCELN